MALKDYRRQDRRIAQNSANPFWIKSAVLDYTTAGKDTVLFSFALNGLYEAAYAIHAAVVRVEETFDGSASLIVGLGTTPTKDFAETDSVTAVDADQFLVSADITEATLGYYGESGSQLATDLGAGKMEFVVAADTLTPCVYAALTASGATKGKCRVLLLISRID